MNRQAERAQLSKCEAALRALYEALEANQLSAGTAPKIQAIATALEAKDYAGVSRVHLELIQSAWTEVRAWIQAVRDLNTLCRTYQV